MNSGTLTRLTAFTKTPEGGNPAGVWIGDELPEPDVMKLYSAWYCPFAQRAWLSLLQKDVSIEYIEIDPYDKTPAWLNISRGGGQVPVIEVASRENEISTVTDSLRIIEFIDDYYPNEGAAIFPESPQQKAEAKYWMDVVSTKIIPYFYRFLKADQPGEARDAARTKMLEGIELFTRAMPDQGPFFMGPQFGAVDIAFAPFAHRINLLLGHYRGFKLPTNGDSWSRYHRWYEAVIAEPGFVKTSFDQHNYEARLIEFYLPYSQGGGQSDVTAI